MSTSRVRLRSLAKINLDLRVLNKRTDGFHELRTIFQTVSLADEIEVEYTPARATKLELDSSVEIADNLILRAAELAIEAMPSFLLPRKGRYELRDYEKMFCPDLKSGDDIFDMRGIDRDRGCMVVVRPDQYVAHILPLDAHTELAAFFDGFMKQDD